MVQAGQDLAPDAARTRIARTRRWLDRMCREIDAWIETRHRKDTLGQYHSHLTVLGSTLGQALAHVRHALDAAPTGAGAVYRACRAIDADLVFVHRLWRYFADKLEQRDGPMGDLLRGADEVVWSLYAPVVRKAQLADARVAFLGPPLPYVEPAFSPRIIPRSMPPRDLRPPGSKRDRLFAELVSKMPIPVVSLPPWCVSQPWWLIYLAHEVGHHVEHDLLPQGGLIGAVQEGLLAMLGGDALDPATGRWLSWNEEMFADVYAALTAGPAAVWALAEIVWGEDAQMLAEQAMYPSPAVRLALGHATCTRAGAAPQGFQGRDIPDWLESWAQGETRAGLAADRERAEAVAATLCDLSIGSSTLASVCAVAFDAPFAAGGRVAQLAAGLNAPGGPLVTADAEAARLLTSAAVLAYRDLGAGEAGDAARAEAEARLRAAYFDAVLDSREAGTRGAELPDDAESKQRGEALGDVLVEGLRALPEDAA